MSKTTVMISKNSEVLAAVVEIPTETLTEERIEFSQYSFVRFVNIDFILKKVGKKDSFVEQWLVKEKPRINNN